MILLKHGDRTHELKELPRDLEEGLIKYLGVGGGKVKRKFLKGFSYAQLDSHITGDLDVVKLRLFCFLAKH